MRILKVLMLLLVGALVVVPVASRGADSPTDAFKREWKGRKVLLVQTIYSIIYPAVGFLSPGEVNSRSAAITVVSPEKGTYYYARPKGTEISDSDPERLVARVTAISSNQSLESLFGANQRNVTAPPVVLLTYKPGTRMTVADVAFPRDQWVRLDLDDEFHKSGPHTTSLLIEWAQRFSKTFNERATVEELIAKFLTAQQNPPPADASGSAPTARPAAPASIEIGQTIDQVVAVLGPPATIVKLGPKEIYVYKDLKITFLNGKVSQVE